MAKYPGGAGEGDDSIQWGLTLMDHGITVQQEAYGFGIRIQRAQTLAHSHSQSQTKIKISIAI